MGTLSYNDDQSILVGHPTIDAEHRDFARHLNALLQAEDAALADALDVLIEHAASHFASEEELMARHACPASDCHADEHARVLESLREARLLLALGERAIVRELALALADWFPGHAAYLDSAVANWVAKKTLGGAPIVLRRMRQPHTGTAAAAV